jgi:hypothetical protein
VAFMAAGIPAVEFGPDGAGHHGPEEWVSVSSLSRYRRSLVGFVRTLPMWLERSVADGAREGGRDGAAVEDERDASEDVRSGLTAIDGGLA